MQKRTNGKKNNYKYWLNSIGKVLKGGSKMEQNRGKKKKCRVVFNASGNDPKAERGILHLVQELT
jgi:hypothetical protein